MSLYAVTLIGLPSLGTLGVAGLAKATRSAQVGPRLIASRWATPGAAPTACSETADPAGPAPTTIATLPSAVTDFRHTDPRDVPAYTVGEAAHYLGVPKSTMRSWFAGQRGFRFRRLSARLS